jgi:hypothetical protein
MYRNDTFPGMLSHGLKTYAAWPVWKDSTSAEARFAPMSKKQAHRLWHDARRFERQTRKAGCQDGAIGRNGLAVLHALLFDFLNYRSGALYPSWAAIAGAACISERSVGRGLVKLKAAGVLNWLRRCEEVVAAAGGFLMRQISNAYAVLPTSQWKGYRAPQEPPGPAPGTWGARPPEDPYAEAKDDMAARLMVLEAEAKAGSALAAVLARDLRRRINSSANSETARLSMKPILRLFQE